MEKETLENVETLEDVETTKKEKKVTSKKKEDQALLKLQEENAVLNDKVLRLSAEMQNMRRRYEEQLSNMLRYEGEGIIKELLNTIDNFERALNLDESKLSTELKNFLNGFKMIYNNLDGLLKKNEVQVIECLDKQFDPNTMEAVLTDSVKDKEKGIVLEVLQKGYTYKGKVIRHAMVKVNN